MKAPFLKSVLSSASSQSSYSDRSKSSAARRVSFQDSPETTVTASDNPNAGDTNVSRPPSSTDSLASNRPVSPTFSSRAGSLTPAAETPVHDQTRPPKHPSASGDGTMALAVSLTKDSKTHIFGSNPMASAPFSASLFASQSNPFVSVPKNTISVSSERTSSTPLSPSTTSFTTNPHFVRLESAGPPKDEQKTILKSTMSAPTYPTSPGPQRSPPSATEANIASDLHDGNQEAREGESADSSTASLTELPTNSEDDMPLAPPSSSHESVAGLAKGQSPALPMPQLSLSRSQHLAPGLNSTPPATLPQQSVPSSTSSSSTLSFTLPQTLSSPLLPSAPTHSSLLPPESPEFAPGTPVKETGLGTQEGVEDENGEPKDAKQDSALPLPTGINSSSNPASTEGISESSASIKSLTSLVPETVDGPGSIAFTPSKTEKVPSLSSSSSTSSTSFDAPFGALGALNIGTTSLSGPKSASSTVSTGSSITPTIPTKSDQPKHNDKPIGNPFASTSSAFGSTGNIGGTSAGNATTNTSGGLFGPVPFKPVGQGLFGASLNLGTTTPSSAGGFGILPPPSQPGSNTVTQGPKSMLGLPPPGGAAALTGAKFGGGSSGFGGFGGGGGSGSGGFGGSIAPSQPSSSSSIFGAGSTNPSASQPTTTPTTSVFGSITSQAPITSSPFAALATSAAPTGFAALANSAGGSSGFSSLASSGANTGFGALTGGGSSNTSGTGSNPANTFAASGFAALANAGTSNAPTGFGALANAGAPNASGFGFGGMPASSGNAFSGGNNLFGNIPTQGQSMFGAPNTNLFR